MTRLLLHLRLFLWRFRRPRFRVGDIVYNINGAAQFEAACWRECGRATLARYLGRYVSYCGHRLGTFLAEPRPVISELWLTTGDFQVACGYFWRLPPALGERSFTTLTTHDVF